MNLLMYAKFLRNKINRCDSVARNPFIESCPYFTVQNNPNVTNPFSSGFFKPVNITIVWVDEPTDGQSVFEDTS